METVALLVQMISRALALVAEAIGALVVAVALARAGWWYARDLVGRGMPMSFDSLRLSVGRGLGLALEFLLAADILRTAVDPTWDEIGRLAAIAAIRTALNFFLQREIAAEAQRNEPAGD